MAKRPATALMPCPMPDYLFAEPPKHWGEDGVDMNDLSDKDEALLDPTFFTGLLTAKVVTSAIPGVGLLNGDLVVFTLSHKYPAHTVRIGRQRFLVLHKDTLRGYVPEKT